MRFTSLLSTILVSLSAAVVAQAQEPTGNLTASLVTYSTNQCCGGSIGYNHLQEGQCVPSAGHPSIYGASITIHGFWGSDFPGGNDNIAYGYLSGFSDSRCQNKVYDIKWNGCTSIGENQRAGSWMWTRETYTPPIRRSLDIGSTVPSTSVTTWVSYFDEKLGRERRISLNRDASEVAEILKLHEEKNYDALSKLEQSEWLQCVKRA